VASHDGLMLDILDVIEHDPLIFQISFGLHLFDQVHPGSEPHPGHIENKHLVQVRALSRELILLNIGPVATASKHGDAVHDLKSSYIPERGDVVLNAWKAHIFQLVKNRG
jgi:hypothetical protein